MWEKSFEILFSKGVGWGIGLETPSVNAEIMITDRPALFKFRRNDH